MAAPKPGQSRLTGINPLSYMGVEPSAPPGFLWQTRDPTPNDSKGYDLGQMWLNTNTRNVWILVSLSGNVAVWVDFTGGGAGAIQTITGNTGGPLLPTAGNFNFLTANTNVLFSGVGSTETLDFVPASGNLFLGVTGASLTSGTGNVSVGQGALNGVTSGSSNVSVGELSGEFLTSATGCTFAGFGAGNKITTGSVNTVVGSTAFQNATTGGSNVSIGGLTLSSLTTGSVNTVVGTNTAANLISGGGNIILGGASGNNYTGAESYNICIGSPGLLGESHTIRIGLTGSGPNEQDELFLAGVDGVDVGSVSTVLTMNPSEQVGTAVITAGSGISVTPGANTITISATGGLGTVTTLTGNTGGPVSPTTGNINVVTANTNVVFAGSASTETLDFNLTSNLLLGSAGSIAGGSNNVGLGRSALTANTSGSQNTGIGALALLGVTTGSNNSALGYASAASSATLFGNTAFGYLTLSNATGAAQFNTALGYNSGTNYTTNESNNILLGNPGVTSENNTIRIGKTGSGAAEQNTLYLAGVDGVNVGSVAKVLTMASEQVGTASITAGSGITVTPTANAITIAVSGTGVVQTITGNTGGAISPTAGNINIVTSNTNVIFAGAGSTETLNFNLTSNLLLGSSGVITSGTNNVGVGRLVLALATSGANNTGVGANVLESLDVGIDNTAVGNQALAGVQGGSLNSAFGHLALNAIVSSNSNCAFGSSSLSALLASTGSNTAYGTSSGLFLTTGARNSLFGNTAGSAYTSSESDNICIGNAGIITENHVIHIGTTGSGSGQQNKMFLAGVDGVNVGSVAKVLTMASEQVGTATITPGTGISVTPTANTITIAVSGTGVLQTITGNTGGAISPTAGNINIVTANSNVVFAGAGSTETLDFNLTSNLLLGSAGSITSGTNNIGVGRLTLALATSGANNTAVGANALASVTIGSLNSAFGSGSLTNGGATGGNCAFGNLTLNATTTSNLNCAFGLSSLSALSGSAGSNSAFGTSSGLFLLTGARNSLFGNAAGSAYVGAENDNICIGHAGIAAENNTIHIGTTGSGSGQQSRMFLAGVDGVNVGSVAKVLTMASEQVGTSSITAGTGISVTPGANTITISATGTTTLTYTAVSTTPYVVLLTDDYLGVNSSGGARTIQLPNGPATGRVWIIKDTTGSAASNNITVTTVSGAVTLDGATTFVMNSAYQSVQVIFNGSSYEIF